MALTGKTIGQLTYLSGVTTDTLFAVELSGDTYHVAYSAFTSGNYTSVTYDELYSLYTGLSLTPGTFYLINDFQTCYDQPNYDSSGQPITTGNFKSGSTEQIVIFATSNNTLSPQAFSIDYPNDVLKYDIAFNFTEVTNTPAKGRITERIDNFNNRTDYDMRAVQFIRYVGFYSENIYDGKVSLDPDGFVIGVGTSFTSDFTNGDIFGVKQNNNANTISCFEYYEIVSITDDLNMVVTGTSIQSVNNTYYSNGIQLPNYMNPHQCNVISLTGSDEYYTFPYDDDGAYNNYIGDNSDYDTFILSNNVFQDGSYRDNFFGANCVGNTFDDDCDSNTIGVRFQFNIINDDFDENTIETDFRRNIIVVNFNRNIISEGFERNMIGDEDGSDFQNNEIGVNFTENFITMSDVFENNNIGVDFTSNIIDSQFENNKIFGGFIENYVTSDFQDNQIGRFFYNNTILNDFEDNVIGGSFSTNSNVSNISNNVFGNDCNNNIFGNNNISGTFEGNIIGNNFDNNFILTSIFDNHIGNDFDSNSIFMFIVGNTIGEQFQDNNIGISGVTTASLFSGNVILGNFKSNGISGDTKSNTIGGDFHDNNIGEYFEFNKIGSNFQYNTIANDFGFGGGAARGNTIGNFFQYNTIGEYFYDNQVSDLFGYNTTGEYFQLNNISAYELTGVDFTINYGNIITISYIATGLTATDGVYIGINPSLQQYGNGATFDITVSGGQVTDIVINESGILYQTGGSILIDADSISGSGESISITVDSISPTPVVYTSTNANIVKNSSSQNKLYYLGGSGIEFVDITSPFD